MMVFILLLLNLSIFSRDISIVWFTENKNSIEDILKFKEENNLDFEMNIVAPYYINISSDSSFEVCDVFGQNVLFMSIFFPSYTGILKNKLSNMPQLFEKVFNKYYERFKSKKCIFFYPGVISSEILNITKNSNYIWIGGINSGGKNDVYEYDKMKVVLFDKLTSTDTIYTSSSSFFILDDLNTSTSSVSLLKLLFSTNTFNFVKVSENFKFNVSSISFSTAAFQMDISSPVFKCDRERNYFYYLSSISKDFSNVSDTTSFINDYLTLIEFFPEICGGDNIEDIRNITFSLYRIAGLEIPPYVYDNFLDKNILAGYTKILKDNIIYYVPDSDDKPIFYINESSGNIVFTIEKSTSIKEFYIYIDINKLNRVGIEKAFDEEFSFYPDFAWEYAFAFKKGRVSFYKMIGRDYKKMGKFRILEKDNSLFFTISKTDMPGNFLNWDYILIYYTEDNKKEGIYNLVFDKFLKPVK